MSSEFNSMPPGLDRRQLLRGAAGALATGTAATVLASLSGAARASSDPIQVGGLPVTCNLTLPVACAARAAENSALKSGGPPSNSSTASTTAGRRSRNR